MPDVMTDVMESLAYLRKTKNVPKSIWRIVASVATAELTRSGMLQSGEQLAVSDEADPGALALTLVTRTDEIEFTAMRMSKVRNATELYGEVKELARSLRAEVESDAAKRPPKPRRRASDRR